MKKLIVTVTAVAIVGTSYFTANAAGTYSNINVAKETTAYCNKDLNEHRRNSLFPNVSTSAKLDTITCHSDTSYDNDYDFGGKDTTKGDTQ